MNRHRILLAIRAIDVSHRSSLRHAPPAGRQREEWLGRARERAEQLLDSLESRLPPEAVDPETALQLRIVRENIRRSDVRAWADIEARDDEAEDTVT